MTAVSSNTGLIPDPVVTYTSPDTTGSLTFSLVAVKSTTTITVTVEDDGLDDDLDIYYDSSVVTV